MIGLVPEALSQNFLTMSFGKKTFVKSAPCIVTFSNCVLYAKESSRLVFDKFDSLKVGFAENDKVLEKKLSSNGLILLDREKGKKKDLFLLVTTLKELGIKYSDNLYFKYSDSLMRHLSTLGWPVGKSLYKQRKIKKELVCA